MVPGGMDGQLGSDVGFVHRLLRVAGHCRLGEEIKEKAMVGSLRKVLLVSIVDQGNN
jgi:hypothetical protein